MQGKGGDIGKSEEQLVADLIEIHNSDNWLGDDTETSPAEMTSLDQNLMKMREERRGVEEVEESGEELESKARGDPHCYECRVKYRDPSPADLMMYLHALRYQVGTNGSPLMSDCCLERVKRLLILLLIITALELLPTIYHHHISRTINPTIYKYIAQVSPLTGKYFREKAGLTRPSYLTGQLQTGLRVRVTYYDILQMYFR